jgi:hypothetical protein
MLTLSPLLQEFQHFSVTESGFVYRHVPNLPLQTSQLAFTTNLLALALSCISQNSSPTSFMFLRTQASTLANYIAHYLSRSSSPAEFFSTPLCFYLYAASNAADHYQLTHYVCPALEIMTRTWKVSKFFLDVCKTAADSGRPS